MLDGLTREVSADSTAHKPNGREAPGSKHEERYK
jgi:hypothetical protein